MSRDRVMAILWPESDTERARALLRDSVYRLREALGASAVLTEADEIRLDADQTRCDVCDFEDAVRRGDLAEADNLYAGAFLDGFFLHGSADFERWVDAERSRLAEMHARILETIAGECAERKDFAAAIAAWRRRAASDPYNSRVALRLMKALEAGGDRAGALHHGLAYAALVKSEFGAAPDAPVAECIAQLRGDPGYQNHSLVRRPVPAPVITYEETDLSASPEPASALQQLPMPRPVPRRGPWSRYVAAGLTIAAVTAFPLHRWYSGRPEGFGIQSDLIAVLPFHVAAPDTSHQYLREGIVDLLSAQLTGRNLPRAVDARTVIGAYSRTLRQVGSEYLDVQQSLALARRVGAGKLILGEFVETRTGAQISARLIGVSNGRVLAEHVETGNGDELRLVKRLASALIAKSFGERASRVTGLSDSTEAVRAYLAGMRDYRTGRVWEAVKGFDRALEIDSTFAVAAFWRSVVGNSVSNIPPDSRRRADSVAWTFRQRVNRRDSIALASLRYVGANWPQLITGPEWIAALERAAKANPDRPEIWHTWGRVLRQQGKQAGITDYLTISAYALDSALALDPDFEPALFERVLVSVLSGDRPAIRKFGDLYARSSTESKRRAEIEWMVARALGETSKLPVLLDRLALVRDINNWRDPEIFSAYHGLATLTEAQRSAEFRLAHTPGKLERRPMFHSLATIAVLGGHPRLALALADSLADDAKAMLLLNAALMGPGYDSAAWIAVRFFEKKIDADDTTRAVDNISILCRTQLWRALQGDTAHVRQSVTLIDTLMRSAPSPEARGFAACPTLLEAAVAQHAAPRHRSRALDKLTYHLLQGTDRWPVNFGNVIAARWLEAAGDDRMALAVLRRIDPMFNWISGPAALRMEGRLSAKLSDKPGALHAYERFLALRSNADPGPLADEVRAVRQEVVRLVSAPTAPSSGLQRANALLRNLIAAGSRKLEPNRPH